MVTTLYLIRHGETEGADERRYKGSIDVPLSERGVQQIKQVSQYIVQDNFNRSSRSVGTSRLSCLNDLNPETSGNNLNDLNDLNGLNRSFCLNDLNDLNGLNRSFCLNDLNILNAVYCSDLSRAIKSAEIIAAPSRLKPVIIPDLRERSFGIWEGMSFDEIKEKYLEEFNVWTENPVKFSPMEGESTLEVRERVIRALDMILKNHNRQNKEYRAKSKEHRTKNTDKNGLCSESIAIVAHGGVNRIILCHIMGIPLENIFRIEQDFAAVNIIEFWDNYPVVKLINYIVQDSSNRSSRLNRLEDEEQ